MFLLVPAYPGCPGSKAVKRSLLLTVQSRYTLEEVYHSTPLKLRPYGAIQISLLLLLLFAAKFQQPDACQTRLPCRVDEEGSRQFVQQPP